MIRPMRDEVERYGHYSLAAESMYDHPFQWGSKRTGPDLARVGGRYSDAWHVEHLIDPRSVVPTSIMPPYRHLATTTLDPSDIAERLTANARLGVPYTAEMIADAKADVTAQAQPDADVAGLTKRYGKVPFGAFDGDASRITEMDALVSYLQMLGTTVNFTSYEPLTEANRR
jgi:cytochrome c oxidase cbb3-type subunit 2